MFKKFKENLLSENGMKIVNLMFIIAVFASCSLGLTGVFILWLFYLGFCFKNTRSKVMKVFYGALAVFAAAYVLFSLYFFVTDILCFLTGIRCPNL